MNIIGLIITILFFVISFLAGFWFAIIQIALMISREPNKFCKLLKDHGYLDNLLKEVEK